MRNPLVSHRVCSINGSIAGQLQINRETAAKYLAKKAGQEVQERWKKKNPNYWKEYRARHPEYTRKNRQQQRRRNRKRQQNTARGRIAKTDELTQTKNILTGRYRIIPLQADKFVKTDECIVEIVAISSG